MSAPVVGQPFNPEEFLASGDSTPVVGQSFDPEAFLTSGTGTPKRTPAPKRPTPETAAPAASSSRPASYLQNKPESPRIPDVVQEKVATVGRSPGEFLSQLLQPEAAVVKDLANIVSLPFKGPEVLASVGGDLGNVGRLATGAVNAVLPSNSQIKIPARDENEQKSLEHWTQKRGDEALMEAPVSTVLGAAGMAPLARGAMRGAGTARRLVRSAPVAERVASLTTSIRDNYARALKPRGVRGTTLPLDSADVAKGQRGVEVVTKHRGQTGLVDAEGAPVTKLPDTVVEALDQTYGVKKWLYEKFSGLQDAAGSAGAVVSGSELANKLRNFKKSAASRMGPEDTSAMKLADDWIAKVDGRDWTIGDAQAELQSLNTKLEAWKQKPDLATVDAKLFYDGLSGDLRNLMDDSIESYLGKGASAEHAAAKADYGAVRKLENDLVRRSRTIRNKDPKSGADYIDVATLADFGSAIASGNPLYHMARGGMLEFGKRVIQRANSPDRMVRAMFKDAESLLRERGELGATPPQTATASELHALDADKRAAAARAAERAERERFSRALTTKVTEESTARLSMEQPSARGEVPKGGAGIPREGLEANAAGTPQIGAAIERNKSGAATEQALDVNMRDKPYPGKRPLVRKTEPISAPPPPKPKPEAPPPKPVEALPTTKVGAKQALSKAESTAMKAAQALDEGEATKLPKADLKRLEAELAKAQDRVLEMEKHLSTFRKETPK